MKVADIKLFWLTFLVICMACSHSERIRVLSFFFDGVEEESRMEKAVDSVQVIGGQNIKIPKRQLVRVYTHPQVNGNSCSPCHAINKAYKLKARPDELCLTCHEKLIQVQNAHDPADEGECIECHKPHGTSNEHILREPVPLLCFECHDNDEKEYVHDPVEEGECTECHNPHGSDNLVALIEKPGLLCFECHDGYEDDTIVHDPVSEGECIECHNPHSSDHQQLLRNELPTLCQDCHSNFAEAPFVHDPVEEGECLECHSVHSSKNESLLVMNGQALCFQCHDEDIKETETHEDIGDDACYDCHNPHNGDEEYYL